MSRRLLVSHELNNAIQTAVRMHRRSPRAVPSESDLQEGDGLLIRAHAIFEFYIEEMCRRVIHASACQYEYAHRTTKALSCLSVSHYWSRAAELPRGANFDFMAGSAAIASASNWYLKKINKNNGVKRSNILSLVLPIGVEGVELDELWLSSMDNFGAGRGDAAHGKPHVPIGRPAVHISPSGNANTGPHPVEVWPSTWLTTPRVRQPPWDVIRTLQSLISGLVDLDRVITSKLAAL